MTARRRPWFVPVCRVEPWLSVKPVSALITAEKFGGAAHGVPVCFAWYKNVGTHGTKSRHPTATAISAASGPCSGCPRRRVRTTDASNHRPTKATR